MTSILKPSQRRWRRKLVMRAAGLHPVAPPRSGIGEARYRGRARTLVRELRAGVQPGESNGRPRRYAPAKGAPCALKHIATALDAIGITVPAMGAPGCVLLHTKCTSLCTMFNTTTELLCLLTTPPSRFP